MQQPTASPTDSSREPAEPALNLVAIGASAGGVQALRSFFKEVPEQSGIAFVVIMHLSPEHDSQLAEVLQSRVRIPVSQVTARTRLEPDHVYVIPPNRSMTLDEKHLALAPFDEPRGRRAPIDTFFRTVATRHPDGIGVLLSGTGTDGVAGLKAMKEHGGVIMAQSPDEAEFDTMPRSAVATGLIDFVLPARELGAKVVQLRSTGVPWSRLTAADVMRGGSAADVRAILNELHARSGHDFSEYKKNTVMRRIARRMQVTQTERLSDYVELLRQGGETTELLKDLLISVTSFFRDPDAFAALAERVIPTLFANRSPGDQIRFWAPGCATGEEAYSLAMLLHEHRTTAPHQPPLQVFATDIDEGAISVARAGLYPAAIAADVSDERLERFFRREGDFYRVSKQLRDTVLFSSHNLLRDPPFSRLDLISSRNLLIYLERDLQERLIDLFLYTLRPNGYLLLGMSESVPEGNTAFRPLDKQHRLYQRTNHRRPGAHLPHLPLAAAPYRGALPLSTARPPEPRQARSDLALHHAALERAAPPSLVVDENRVIVHSSERAGRYLEFPPGTPTADLLKTVHRELRTGLRAALYDALQRRVASTTGWISVAIEGEPRRVQVHAAPTATEDGARTALVVFLETPGPDRGAVPPSAGDEADGEQLERTEGELDSVRERLQAVVETAESREEELRASNEELQSINEEYKSTLEELETSKEELQSINEELKTVNDELKVKIDQLARANDDLNNLMAATEIATLFLDVDLRIQRFTPALTSLFNIVPSDVGRPLAHVTHQLRYGELVSDCRTVLATGRALDREVGDDADGFWLARITPYRSERERVGGVVVTLTDISRIQQAGERLRESEERFRALVTATSDVVWTADRVGAGEGDRLPWRAFSAEGGDRDAELEWLEDMDSQDRRRIADEWSEAVRSTNLFETEFRVHRADGAFRMVAVRAVPIHERDGSVREWVGMCIDITERKLSEIALREAKEAAERAASARSQFLATMSHELRTPLTAVIGMAELLETEVLGPVTLRQRQHLERIKAAAWHLVAIIDEVLTYSRTTAGREPIRARSVDLAPVIRDIVSLLESEVEPKGVAMEAVGIEEPVIAVTDVGKFRQIAVNLVGNAVKFTDEGFIRLALRASTDEIVLDVHDSGCGIPAERIDDMFQPFIQGDNSMTRPKGGTGLGLSVARRLARLLGGEIHVDSQPGVGSTFTLRLPRDAGAQQPR